MHGTIALKSLRNRKGRKRKQRIKLAGGPVIRPDPQPDYRLLSSLQPHRRDLPEDQRLDPLASSALGRSRLQGLITEEQMEAGRQFAVCVGRFRSIFRLSGSGGNGTGRSCPAGGCGDVSDDCLCQGSFDRYNKAHDALAGAGRHAVLAVKAVAIEDRECLPHTLDDLKRGLTALHEHFGLVARGRVRIVGERSYPWPDS